MYFNARFYDPAMGRFVTLDPVKDGVNWYVYCGNNPLRYVDPTGLFRRELSEFAKQAIEQAVQNPAVTTTAVTGVVSTLAKLGPIGFILGFVLCLQGDTMPTYDGLETGYGTYIPKGWDYSIDGNGNEHFYDQKEMNIITPMMLSII